MGILAYCVSVPQSFLPVALLPKSVFSFSSVLISIALPYLITIIVIAADCPSLILLVCFFEAACISFCGTSISAGDPSWGWFLAWCLLFGKRIILLFLYLLWLRFLSTDKKPFLEALLGCLPFVFLIGCVHYCLVSPFLVFLLNFQKG